MVIWNYAVRDGAFEFDEVKEQQEKDMCEQERCLSE